MGSALIKLYPDFISKFGLLQLLALMTLLACLVLLVLRFFEGILFGRRNTLADKMMSCPLRKQHGLNYCVECPDSYTCPTDMKV